MSASTSASSGPSCVSPASSSSTNLFSSYSSTSTRRKRAAVVFFDMSGACFLGAYASRIQAVLFLSGFSSKQDADTMQAQEEETWDLSSSSDPSVFQSQPLFFIFLNLLHVLLDPDASPSIIVTLSPPRSAFLFFCRRTANSRRGAAGVKDRPAMNIHPVPAVAVSGVAVSRRPPGHRCRRVFVTARRDPERVS
ncbi:hypothetical protein EYF80_038360 [Liparis tanakae]|uniref:Uncharacterized protein n=1 Tax=Liparis tanakae TaxID=230148 RepID=A0A4Z2GD23_9TELE|nr:hypothetical protein EYF80_038360 [Liparis tanakae]